MRLLAIDGNSIINKGFYAIKSLLSNKDGILTNAVTGFMNIYLKEREEIKPDCVAVAFDMSKPTFRHTAVASYKANRHGMPDELAQQMPTLKEMLKNMGVAIIEKEGFEADDILGTLAKSCSEQKNECYILTGDRDALQLIDEFVTIRLSKQKETVSYTNEVFKAEYGFEPIQMIDFKGLSGDSSDNISGVKGIGAKTATALIQRWGTIENIYENYQDSDITKAVKQKLEIGAEQAKESKWLATIKCDVPINTDINTYKPTEGDTLALKKQLVRLEMVRLISRLKLENVTLDTENEIMESPIEKPALEFIELKEDYIELFDNKAETVILFNAGILQANIGEKVYFTENKDFILRILSSDSLKTTFKAKPIYHFVMDNGYELKNVMSDIEVCAYLLDTNSEEYTIEKLCIRYNIPYNSDQPNADFYGIYMLAPKLYKMVEENGMLSLLKDIELPLTEVLAGMEDAGIKVDKEGVNKFGEMLKAELSGLQAQIYFMAGVEFNISSPKQLAEVLVNNCNIKLTKKTKTGYSTNAEVLESLKAENPIIDLILQYRQYSKLNSTYVDGLLKTVEKDGRIHTVFKQTETRTGRISSTEPNMQNIPVRTETGREMRKFFIAEEGKVLLDADYSQIELRILAHMCRDENMQSAFRHGMDIHTVTASQIFGVPEEKVTKEMRNNVKAVNFGIIYGIGAFSLSQDINVSVAEAKYYIESYLKRYPEVDIFMTESIENAIKNGYVTTMFGRRRYIPELKTSNANVKAFGKRVAMNAPIQGSAADIIKIAMVKVYKRLKAEKLNARLILQVHDELIVEADKECAERAGIILGEEMSNATALNVPLIAEVNRGENWDSAKG